MCRQIDIFDFIEIPKTLFEQIFEKVNNPVLLCANCLCQYCANNVETPCSMLKPGEMQEPCFNCDECYTWSGEWKHRQQNKEDCNNFVLSDFGAERNRKRLGVSGGTGWLMQKKQKDLKPNSFDIKIRS